MAEPIRVAVSGAAGKMGREVVRAVSAAEDLELVAAFDPASVGRDAGEVAGTEVCGVGIRDSAHLALGLREAKAEVLVDFTHPTCVVDNVDIALAAGVRPVVGTSGIREADLERWRGTCRAQGLGAVIAPNFAIGAVLMMKMCEMAARHMGPAEVIELHHEQKADSPSGTALKTAEMIAKARGAADPAAAGPPERGLSRFGVRLHSVRLPGLVAHQEVIFGGLDQTLTIRHDSISRASFMPGVLLAVRKVIHLRELVYGLEHLLDLG